MDVADALLDTRSTEFCLLSSEFPDLLAATLSPDLLLLEAVPATPTGSDALPLVFLGGALPVEEEVTLLLLLLTLLIMVELMAMFMLATAVVVSLVGGAPRGSSYISRTSWEAAMTWRL